MGDRVWGVIPAPAVFAKEATQALWGGRCLLCLWLFCRDPKKEQGGEKDVDLATEHG